MGLACFYVVDALSEILNGIIEVHESSMDETTIEVI